MKQRSLVLTVSILTAFALSACKSGTTGPGNSGTPLTVPKAGSVFTYDQYSLDSSDMKSGIDVLGTDSILATGVPHNGKSNTTKDSIFVPHASNSGNTDFVSYESNGDISFYDRSGDWPGHAVGYPGYRSGWITVPLVSHGTTTFKDYDTTEVGHYYSRTESYAYVDDEDLTLSGHTYQAAKFIHQRFDQDHVNDLYETVWYERNSGIYLETDRPDNWLNHPNGGVHIELTSYTIR